MLKADQLINKFFKIQQPLVVRNFLGMCKEKLYSNYTNLHLLTV
jgi:hypothetical protein